MISELLPSDAVLKTRLANILAIGGSERVGTVVLHDARTSDSATRPKGEFLNPETRNYNLGSSLRVVMHVVTRPTVLAIYVVAVWSLTASMGFTNAFPWSTGPLSSWLVWLALAVLANLAASKFQLGVHVSD